LNGSGRDDEVSGGGGGSFGEHELESGSCGGGGRLASTAVAGAGASLRQFVLFFYESNLQFYHHGIVISNSFHLARDHSTGMEAHHGRGTLPIGHDLVMLLLSLAAPMEYSGPLDLANQEELYRVSM
jgi:hypothetical protein